MYVFPIYYLKLEGVTPKLHLSVVILTQARQSVSLMVPYSVKHHQWLQTLINLSVKFRRIDLLQPFFLYEAKHW